MRLWFLLAVALAAHADVTLRYQIDSSPAMPPGILDQATTMRMKGGKGLTAIGRLTAVIDFTRREITLIDAGRKTFAAFPLTEYAAKAKQAAVGKMPEGAPPLPKFDGKSAKTGRTAKILGIDCEETELGYAMQMGQMGVSMNMRSWTPTAAEVLRVPAVRELTALGLWFTQILGGAGDFQIPGLDGVALRMEMDVRMTGDVPGVDTSKPVFHLKMEAAELSADPIDEALFRVPEGFTARPAEEILKTALTSPETAVAVDVAGPGAVQAFVPHLDPVDMPHLDHPHDAAGQVQVIVTVDAAGAVVNAQPLTGPEPLRKLAVQEVRGYKYRSVLRDGKPVVAMTDTTVFFESEGGGPMPMPDMTEMMTASERISALEEAYPRSPGQVLADLEHDAGDQRALLHSTDLAKAALDASALDKAERYARLALSEKPDENDVWNRGNRVHTGHIVLGRVALRRDDLSQARAELLAAGKTSGSPQLNSFGPDLSLARELLAKGDTAAVLDYFEECRAFWTMGASRLDAWIADLRAGRKPVF